MSCAAVDFVYKILLIYINGMQFSEFVAHLQSMLLFPVTDLGNISIVISQILHWALFVELNRTADCNKTMCCLKC